MNSGHVFVFVGPSGSGKTTLIQYLQERGIGRFLPTTTTRPPRNGELSGMDYNFVSMDLFLKLRDEQAFLECQEIHGNWYGSPRKEVEQMVQSGETGLMSLDVLGGYRLRTAFPHDVSLIFIALPNMETLRDRLVARGTEDEASLARRLSRAQMEFELSGGCDAFILNDDLERAARLTLAFIDVTYENKRVMKRLNITPEARKVSLNGKTTLLGPFETSEQGLLRLARD